jgi:membrane dipeptidase
MRPLIDAHLDISWNATAFDRDQTMTIAQIRSLERMLKGKSRGNNTVSFPAMRQGGIGICLATVLARAMPATAQQADGSMALTGKRATRSAIPREDIDYVNQTVASCIAQGQLAYYRLMERQGQMKQIRTRGDLDALWTLWKTPAVGGEDRRPIGYILSMEGADPIVDVEQFDWWWDQGLRTLCLSHYGPSAYAMGTGGDGPLTDAGRKLLAKMQQRQGIILDLVHTADTAVAQAMDLFSGPVFVSHGNCRALRAGDRQMSDEQIKAIAGRGGVIGAVTDVWMIEEDWKGDERHSKVPLAAMARHIDHVCQLTGRCDHAAIGSDLDGGYGTEQSPSDLETIADLQKLGGILAGMGYGDADIDAIFYGNWLRFFRAHLPA